MANGNHKTSEPNDNESLQILQKIEDMFIYAHGIMERWSIRDMRAIGNKMSDCMNDMLEHATSIRYGYYKKTDITALDKRNHHLQTYIKVAYSIGAMRGLSNFKEWTRRSEEIGKMIGGFINASKEAEGNSEAEYTAYQSQKPMRSGGSRYSRK